MGIDHSPDGALDALHSKLRGAMTLDGRDLPGDWTPRVNGERGWIQADGRLLDHRGLLSQLESVGVSSLEEPEHPLALVWWDGERLVLARPPGSAPRLFFRRTGSEVRWASRPSDLIVPGDRVDRARMAAFFSQGHVGGRGFVVAGIEQVGPAEYVVLDRDSTRIELFGVPSWDAAVPADTVEARDRLIRDAFARTLHKGLGDATTPGILLSGGIDSVAVAVGLKTLLDVKPVAFTARLAGYSARFDEFGAAAQTADALGIEHVPIDITPRWIEERLDWMVTAFDEPFAVAVHTSDLRGFVERGLGVLFGGAGGDSWAPTRTVRRGVAVGPFVPHWAARRGVDLIDRIQRNRTFRGLPHLRMVLRYADDLGLAEYDYPVVGTEPGVQERLFGVEATAEGRAQDLEFHEDHVDVVAHLDPGLQVRYLWGYLAESNYNSAWVLRWTEAYGMGASAPFCDPYLGRILTFNATRPGDRIELRDFVAEHIPHEAAYRPKVGQSIPLAEWLREGLREMVEADLTRDAVEADGIFDPDGARALVDEHMAGSHDHGWDIMKLLSVTRWKRVVFDPRANGS